MYCSLVDRDGMEQVKELSVFGTLLFYNNKIRCFETPLKYTSLSFDYVGEFFLEVLAYNENRR